MLGESALQMARSRNILTAPSAEERRPAHKILHRANCRAFFRHHDRAGTKEAGKGSTPRSLFARIGNASARVHHLWPLPFACGVYATGESISRRTVQCSSYQE